MATPTLISSAGFVLGIADDETAINITSFSESWNNPKVYNRDKYGGRQGFAQNHDADKVTAISGETTTDPESVMGVAFATAETIAGDTSGYGVTTGDNLLDDVSVSASADGNTFRNASLNFTKIPGLTVA
jgi:hypothetical protein